jgi:hypothetical protein
LQYPTAHPDTDYDTRAEVTGMNLEEEGRRKGKREKAEGKRQKEDGEMKRWGEPG